MTTESLRFRQVHLDFHTSPLITEIGGKFNKKKWQETLKRAEVDSITCFATCHHGYAYYDTKVGERHPYLNFDLLRAQFDACKEINVNVPIYLTAGVNDFAGERHPEWREISPEGGYQGWVHSPLQPGFKKMCFNTKYLDFLCAEIEEVVTLFPDCDGIFTDIIHQGPCCCTSCMKSMKENGYDPTCPADRTAHARKVLMNYYERTTASAHCRDPKMNLFHNSGNVEMGDREILPYFSHLELESLPTGGWGYDHYPMSAAYSRNLGLDFLGMTGKFHTTWGEFGGFKHPNALRYECAAMIANNSKCSIGDQLHPSGELDESTYEIIGEAYRDVKRKEAFCSHAKSAANTAVLSGLAAMKGKIDSSFSGDTGAARLLLEAHIPFEFVDMQMDWNRFKVLILPDEIQFHGILNGKIDAFLKNGGKLILSGKSGLEFGGKTFALDIGVDHEGESPYCPDYLKAETDFSPDFVKTPFVAYVPSQRIRARKQVRSLGKIFDPYFNRAYDHYSSHQHTPYKTEATPFDCGVMGKNILYFAHPVFTLYQGWGAVAVKEYIVKAIRAFVRDDILLEFNSFPSQGRVTLMKQESEKRYVLHLLYANTILRGGPMQLSGGTVSSRGSIEIIEDLNECPESEVRVQLPENVKSVTDALSGESIPYRKVNTGIVFTAPAFECHRILLLNY